MTREEAAQHLDHRIKSGLLVANTQGDGEGETKKIGTEDLEK